MQKVIYIVKLGHTRVTLAALVEMSRTNIEKLEGNPAFPTTLPPLKDYGDAKERLQVALDDYRFNPSRLGKTERDTAFRELKTMRMELGNFVQAQSQGDLDLIQSAGFEVERKPQPSSKPTTPANLRAKGTEYPSEILVNFNGVKGKLYYRLFICKEDPKVASNWKFHSATSKNRVLVTGMESHSEVHFRVVAVGTAGASPVSDYATAKAA